MAEESQENQTSQQKAPDDEKKVAPPTPKPSAPAPPQAAPAPRPQMAAPKPPVARAAPAPVPPPPKDSGRRMFLKAAFTVGAILSIIPFVPWGRFLTSTVSGGNAKHYLLQKAVIDGQTQYGPAKGKVVNVNDLVTFPPNSHWVITYPTSGDPSLDTQNPDTFLKYELIRLPESLGGASKKATDFVAFSKVCVHLWCSPNYNPSSGHQQYECPCHGSIYQVPDGKAVQGPASKQAPPTNAIPMLTLQADSSGDLYIVSSNRDPRKQFPGDLVPDSIQANGDLGFGRDFHSYQNFIRPLGEIPADLAGAKEVITS